MADIREVPLDNSESPVDIEEIQAEITQPVVDIEEPPVPKKAKAKGRPAGAKNKGPSKPRAKRVVFQEPVASEADDVAAYQGYEPSSPRRNLPIPEFGVNDVAVEMLRLLSDQQQAKAERKRRLYQSWFN